MSRHKSKFLSIVSLNVKGILDPIKRQSTFSILKRSSADIILLQETNTSSKHIPFIQSQWQLPSIWNFYTAILINNKHISLANFSTFFNG